VGDSLGFKFFREKKIGGKRVYYLIYEDLKAVLLVGVSDKKSQQETIDEIKSKLTGYFLVVKDALKQHDEFDHV
jgi:putative component of toxin-antitoxin plasmid stabilization module